MKTLKQRIERLEKIVSLKLKVRLNVEICPRCKELGMNAWQDGVCNLCAYSISQGKKE